MEEKEILQKAIEKAERNGYEFGLHWFFINDIENSEDFKQYTVKYCEDCFLSEEIYKIIVFSQEFAKAFWGSQEHVESRGSYCECGAGMAVDTINTDFGNYFCWQYHLQQTVLEEDTIKYLEQFLED